MDFILIFVILAITVIIGYILSRPFLNVETTNHFSVVKDDLGLAYEELLQEIKAMQSAFEDGDLPEGEYWQGLEEKKQQAANLLRRIDDQMEPGPVPSIRARSQPQQEDQLPVKDNDDDPQGTTICPHCGSTVVSSDKFCANCGKTLKS